MKWIGVYWGNTEEVLQINQRHALKEILSALEVLTLNTYYVQALMLCAAQAVSYLIFTAIFYWSIMFAPI